jgi:hypothetical protein
MNDVCDATVWSRSPFSAEMGDTARSAGTLRTPMKRDSERRPMGYVNVGIIIVVLHFFYVGYRIFHYG